MKNLTPALFMLTVLSTSNLQAQNFNAEASTSFTVWTVNGDVSYSAKKSSEDLVILPGMTLKEDAIVHVASKSSVKLVRNNDIVSLNAEDHYSLNGDMVRKNIAKQSEVTSVFFEKLIASSKYSKAKNSLTATGSGYGTESGKQAKKDQGGGYGTESGKQAKKDQGGGYGTESGKQAKKDQGGGYGTESGKQAKKDQGGGYGTEISENKAKKKKAIKRLKKDRIYKKSKKVQKLLMRAATMEDIDLPSEADLFYKKALSKKPSDPIANQMHAAFLDK